MANANYVQTDFRGGEWSTFSQGRLDDKDYPRGLNVCYNAYPTEAGAWTRRPGTRWVAYTRSGLFAWLFTFAFSTGSPYVMEFTDSNLRFVSKGAYLVMTNDPQVVTLVSTANPAVVTTNSAHGWSTNDTVQFLFTAGIDTTAAGILMNRQFVITVLTTTTFSIADAITGATIDGSTFTMPLNVNVGRILLLASPYTQAQLPSVRIVQAEILSNNVLQGNVICLHGAVAPQKVINTVPDSTNAFASFTIGGITFKDGPYFDPPTGTAAGTITPSAKTGTITLSSAPASTFVSTDVGRLIRLFSEPAAWAVGTTYAIGNIVKYTDGQYYTAIAASTGKAPDTSPTLWAINSAAAVWAWGTIASYISGTSVTVALDSGQDLLYTTPISLWRLGVYSATTGYPTCGVFHEGRLWLAGAQGNRFDASNSNDPFNFAPTAVDGTVGDSNAIAYLFNSDDVNPIYWMATDHTGIICGTSGGEWVITASALNDPLTPTSIQAHRVTKYKVANTPPARAGLGLLFVKAHAKRLMEYVSDAFSGKFLGRHVSEKAQQMTAPNIAQLVYQQDLTPNAWMRMADGSLAGMMYRRDSSFVSEPPTFNAWHRHTLGSGCTLESIASGPNADGTLDTVFMSVKDPLTGLRHIEFMTDTFQEGNTIAQAFFVDGGAPATAAIENAAKTQVTFYGFTMYIGKTITLWVGGLDLGDYVVASDGSITVTLGGAAQSATVGLGLPVFTDAFFNNWVNTSTTQYDVSVIRKFVQAPAALGVQAFIDTSIVAGLETHDAVYDPANNRLIEGSTGNTTADGFKVFSITTGLQTGAAVNLFPTGTAANDKYIKYPFATDGVGNIYWYSSSSSTGVIRKLSLSSMAITASFGTGSTKFYTNQNHCSSPQDMICQTVGGTPFLIVSASVANTGVAVLNAAQMQWAGFTSGITEKTQNICPGFTFNSGKISDAQSFVVGYDTIASTNSLGVYNLTINAAAATFNQPPDVSTPTDIARVLNAGITLTRAGSITPANIDATWTNISGVYGPIFDQTDGNIIIWVKTSDAVTNTAYVMKVNPYTAAIVWKTSGITASQTPSWGLSSHSKTICQSGTLAWMAAGNYFSVNTSTGVITGPTAITGLSTGTGQWWDDQTGRLYLNTTASSLGTGGAPARINTTAATFTTQWTYLQGETAPPASSTQLYSLPTLPAVAGFTYTSQGQLLRKVAEPETGAKNGPAFAKTRRTHRVGIHLAASQAVSIGVDFVNLLPLNFVSGATTLAINSLYTGVMRMEIIAPYDFDNMLAWQITRPYPATVAAIGGFLETNDV